MVFKSFERLAGHCLIAEEALKIAAHDGIELASLEFLHETQELIGEYQQATPPYGSWAPLAEVTKADRVSQGYPADEPELRSGELRDSYYVRVEELEGGVGSDSIVAYAQEAGVPESHLPARPILGYAFVRAEKRGFHKFLEPLRVVLGEPPV